MSTICKQFSHGEVSKHFQCNNLASVKHKVLFNLQCQMRTFWSTLNWFRICVSHVSGSRSLRISSQFHYLHFPVGHVIKNGILLYHYNVQTQLHIILLIPSLLLYYYILKCALTFGLD